MSALSNNISNLSEGGIGNTAYGAQALAASTTGTSNTAVGTFALEGNKISSNNVAVGTDALAVLDFTGLATDGNNVAIGSGAGQSLLSGSFNIYVGTNVGGGSTESGNIRIGLPGSQTATFIQGINGVTTGLAGAAVVVDANGQLGTISSSRRYKEDIQPMADASDRLLKLRPVQFRYKKSNVSGEKPIQYGLIAEEVAEVLPELVVLNKDGQPETVAYHLLPAMLLNELQKEHAKNEQHTQQITAQEKVIQDQAAQLVVAEETIVAMQRKMSEVDALKSRLADLERVTTILAKLNGGDVLAVRNGTQRVADVESPAVARIK
jgi:hypothetical protein